MSIFPVFRFLDFRVFVWRFWWNIEPCANKDESVVLFARTKHAISEYNFPKHILVYSIHIQCVYTLLFLFILSGEEKNVFRPFFRFYFAGKPKGLLSIKREHTVDRTQRTSSVLERCSLFVSCVGDVFTLFSGRRKVTRLESMLLLCGIFSYLRKSSGSLRCAGRTDERMTERFHWSLISDSWQKLEKKITEKKIYTFITVFPVFRFSGLINFIYFVINFIKFMIK